MIEAVSIEDLFRIDRLPKGWAILPIVLYFPLGLLLAILRIFIGLHALLVACLLPKTAMFRNFILRTMCFVLGVLVRESSKKHKTKSAKIIVTNHVTVLDHLAIDLISPCIVPCVWDLPQVLTWVLGYKDLGIKQGQDVLIQNVQRHCRESNLPVLAHPEGATTNGTVGLLKFSTWPFCIGQPVNPIVLEVKRLFFLDISTSVIGSSRWSDLFWFIFSPCTIFNIRHLPEMRYDKEISVEDFTKQVQEAIANGSNVKATNYTCADKIEYLKKVLFSPKKTVQASKSSDNNAQLLSMIHQVKEVLPFTPVDAIRKDLIQTNNVSLTITNLLERTAQCAPEPTAQNSCATPSSTSQTSSLLTHEESCTNSSSPLDQNPASMDLSAATFGKTASERMQSYKERKEKLLEVARNRYKLKQLET